MSYGVAWRYGPNGFSLAAAQRFGAERRILDFVCSRPISKFMLIERPPIRQASSIAYPKADYCGPNPRKADSR